jgi:3-methyl-2-oxobutanoate hydroxymethyltransferase
VPSTVAQAATKALGVPTIGIGAGAATDGQVLVWHDMLGYSEAHAPRFVKRYAEVGASVQRAFADYARDVRASVFPGPEHCYQIDAADEALIRAARPRPALAPRPTQPRAPATPSPTAVTQ